MITVQVKLFATLRRYRPGLKMGQALAVELPAGATVGQLIRELGLPEEEVRMVFVNGLVRVVVRGLHRLPSDGKLRMPGCAPRE